MATVRTYDVVINSRYNAGGVKAGVEEQKRQLSSIEKLHLKNQQDLEKLSRKSQSRLAELQQRAFSQQQSTLSKHNQQIQRSQLQHANRLQDTYQKSLSKQQETLVKEHLKERSTITRHQQHIERQAAQHQQRLEQIDRKAAAQREILNQRNLQIQERDTKRAQQASGLLAPIKAGVYALLASEAVQAFGVIIDYTIRAARSIFDIANATSEAGSRFVDLSEKTGLSAQTLSALNLAAQQTNTDIEALSNGLVRYERTVNEAARGSEQARDKLRRLGLDPQEAMRDLEGSLGKVFTRINSIQDPYKRAEAAQNAFGRSGSDLIPIIKAADGDIEGLIDTARRLGVVFTNEDAKAADQFGDTLAILKLQAQGIAFTFGKELMPIITSAMQRISDSLKENQDTVSRWSKGVANVTAQLANNFVYDVGLMIRAANSFGQSRFGSTFNRAFLSAPRLLGLIPERDYTQKSPGLSDESNSILAAIRQQRRENLLRARGGSGGSGGRGGGSRQTKDKDTFAEEYEKKLLGFRAKQFSLGLLRRPQELEADTRGLNTNANALPQKGEQLFTRERIAELTPLERIASLQKTLTNKEVFEQERNNRALEDQEGLLNQILRAKIDIVNSPYTANLRIEAALQEDILALQRREEEAIISINRAGLELSQKTVYSANQANAAALEFLASQKGVTEIFADTKIGVIQSTFDLIQSGTDKIAEKFGKAAKFVKVFTDALADISKLALTNVFRNLFGLGGPQTGVTGQGGFNLGSILFGGGSTGSFPVGTPGFGGGFPLGGILNFAGVGGPTIPYGLSDAATGATRSRIAGGAPGSGLFGNLNLGGIFGSKGGLLSGLASAAPLLGLGLGAGLGGKFGTLGAIGGGLGGLIGGSALPSIFSGAFAGFTALGIAGLVAAPLLIAGGYFLQRNKLRRAEEKVRNQAILDAFAQIDRVGTDIEKDIRADRLDGASGLNQFRQQSQSIRDQYVEQMSQLKDKKTRSHALRDVSRIDTKITENTARIEAAINAQSVRQSRVATFSPTFATGGYVGDAFNGRVPGNYDRRDDRLIRVSGNEVVLNPRQYAPLIPYMQAAKVPGFANGGATGSSPVTPAISFQMIVTKDDSGNITKAEAVKITPDGKREILGTILRDIESPSGAIVAAITNQQNRRRNGGKL